MYYVKIFNTYTFQNAAIYNYKDGLIMLPMLYFVLISFPSLSTSDTITAMTRIGKWFESSTIQLVTSHEFLKSSDFLKLKNHFPTSPFLLEAISFYPDFSSNLHPLVPRNKEWLTIVALDSTRSYILHDFLIKKFLLINYKNSNPEYVLLYHLKSFLLSTNHISLIPGALKLLIVPHSSPTINTVCIPCSSIPIIESATLYEFDDVWNTYNGNLQNQLVTFIDIHNNIVKLEKVDGDCESVDWSYCGVSYIAELRNFTTTRNQYNKLNHLFDIFERYESHMDYYFFNPSASKADYLVSTKAPFNFYVIVARPRSLKGFESLIEPFS